MADDFDALRTINAHRGDLDPERAARMRARALAGVFGDASAAEQPAGAAVLTEAPDGAPAGDRTTQERRPRRQDRVDHVVRLVPDAAPHEIRLDRDDEPDLVVVGADQSRARSGRRPVAVALAAAAVLALVIGLGIARAGRTNTVVADQPTPTSVDEIATNAATLVDRPLAPGEYAYLAAEEGEPFVDTEGVEQRHVLVRETWGSAAGDGRERRSAIEVVEGGTTVSTFDIPTDTGHVDQTNGFGSFSYDELRALPTDPTALRATLDAEQTVRPIDFTRAQLIRQILAFDATPPAVRAAAIRMLAEDGATLVPDAVDHDGRTGIGIVRERADGFTSVDVVTRDGLLLGSYDVITGDELSPDRAVVWYTPREQRRVASAD